MLENTEEQATYVKFKKLPKRKREFKDDLRKHRKQKLNYKYIGWE